MADQPTTLAHTTASAETRSVHQLILDSVNPEHQLDRGKGLQGVVYRFASNDSFFDQFLIKRFRAVRDVPGQNEASFKQKLLSTSSLTPVESPLRGYNFGQPLMVDTDRSFAILIKQPGKGIDAVIDEDLPAQYGKDGKTMRLEERYHLYLNWLLKDVSDDIFVDLYRKIRRVKDSGMAIDHVKKENLFWDSEAKQFNLIDLFERYELKDIIGPRWGGAIQRPVQLMYAALQGVADPNLKTEDEMVKLLTLDVGHRFQAAGITLGSRTKEEIEKTKELETALKNKITTLFAREVPPIDAPMPKTTIDTETIENMGAAHVADLKDRLSGMLNANGGFAR
jgi:hypothetical protein